MDTESAITAELQRQKISAQKKTWSTDDSVGTIPNWLVTLQQQPGMLSIQGQTLLKKFMQLLEQLPLVKKTGSRGAMLAYLKSVSVELTKIYYVRMRIVELDETLSTTSRALHLSLLETELQQRIVDLTTLLGDFRRA